MFRKLADFSLTRTPLQALGFYIAYFVLALIVGAVLGAISGALFAQGESFQAGFNAGQKVGLVVAVIFPIFISFMVLRSKKLLNNFLYIALLLLSGVLGVFGGALLGLIPAAFLTTRSK